MTPHEPLWGTIHGRVLLRRSCSELDPNIDNESIEDDD
jgi:hypothetical protein